MIAARAALLGLCCGCFDPGARSGPQGDVEGGRERTTGFLEEVLSVGNEHGPEHLVFGQVVDVAGSEERLLVVDADTGVQLFDGEGTHIRTVGQFGQGPGEYENLFAAEFGPGNEIIVQSAAWFTVYDSEGAYLERWPFVTSGLIFDVSMIQTASGSILAPKSIAWAPSASGRPQQGWFDVRASRRGSPVAEEHWPPRDDEASIWLRGRTRKIRRALPFSPKPLWLLTPRLNVLTGVSSEYRFAILPVDLHKAPYRHEREFEPVELTAFEREWWSNAVTNTMREREHGWRWEGAALPTVKPSWTAVLATSDGRIAVLREGRSTWSGRCAKHESSTLADKQKCWETDWYLDIFEEDSGDVLASYAAPEGLALGRAHISGNSLWAIVTEDERVTVRRYLMREGTAH